MRMLDLFSGIGGFTLAASWVWQDDLEIVSFCEIDSYCQKVLKKHWPDVPIVSDIKTMNGQDFGAIDILTGGFPCQPFSVAGQQRGKDDDRYLWPEMFRIIKESRPRWIIGENVTGIINLALDEVLSSLESEGYETQAFIIPACGKDAPHRRDRVWIVGYTVSTAGRQKSKRELDLEQNAFYRQEWEKDSDWIETSNNDDANTSRQRLEGQDATRRTCTDGWNMQLFRRDRWSVEPVLFRMDDGIPYRMDRHHAIGNAIVPQVAAEIMNCIKAIDEITECERHVPAIPKAARIL